MSLVDAQGFLTTALNAFDQVKVVPLITQWLSQMVSNANTMELDVAYVLKRFLLYDSKSLASVLRNRLFLAFLGSLLHTYQTQVGQLDFNSL